MANLFSHCLKRVRAVQRETNEKDILSQHSNRSLIFIQNMAGVIGTHKNLPVSQNQTTSTKSNPKPTLNSSLALTLTVTLNPTIIPDPDPTLTSDPNPNPNNNSNLIK